MTVLPWVPTTAMVGSTIPSNNRYFLTTFGGGRDAQNSACPWSQLNDPSIPRSPTSPSQAWCDGTWWYIADARRGGGGRWPCGTRVRISDPVTGKACVAIVADVGPGWYTDGAGTRRNVEQMAGGAVVDASPLVARHLFGRPEFGFSDHKEVEVVVVDPSTPVGPSGAAGWMTATTAGALIAMAGAAMWWLSRNTVSGVRRNPWVNASDADEVFEWLVASARENAVETVFEQGGVKPADEDPRYPEYFRASFEMVLDDALGRGFENVGLDRRLTHDEYAMLADRFKREYAWAYPAPTPATKKRGRAKRDYTKRVRARRASAREEIRLVVLETVRYFYRNRGEPRFKEPCVTASLVREWLDQTGSVNGLSIPEAYRLESRRGRASMVQSALDALKRSGELTISIGLGMRGEARCYEPVTSARQNPSQGDRYRLANRRRSQSAAMRKRVAKYPPCFNCDMCRVGGPSGATGRFAQTKDQERVARVLDGTASACDYWTKGAREFPKSEIGDE